MAVCLSFTIVCNRHFTIFFILAFSGYPVCVYVLRKYRSLAMYRDLNSNTYFRNGTKRHGENKDSVTSRGVGLKSSQITPASLPSHEELQLFSAYASSCPCSHGHIGEILRGLVKHRNRLSRNEAGKDVVILQNLLPRSCNVTSTVKPTGFYDKQTAVAVAEYKRANMIKSDPELFDEVTADLVLDQLSYDGYQDDRQKPIGYKFKIHIPVHKDRNVETEGTLVNANNEVMYRFRVRAHGSVDSSGKAVNQFTTDGNTPTGLVTCDLNTKEPVEKSFGPYPIIRLVKGLKGNAAIGKNANNTFLSDYRIGILIHTGEWEHWNSSMNMPNSNGCLHVHPDDMKTIDSILMNELGVKLNPNPFGKLPYPYPCQGLVSIEQIDGKKA